MVIQEVLHGLPADLKDVKVETAAGTSCYMRLKKDERYVIYGSKMAEGRVRRNMCSFSFAVSGNEALLSALRDAEHGKAQRLVGKVQMKAEEYDVHGEGAVGMRIVASAGAARLETTTNGSGEFQFLNVEPGSYHLAVDSPDVFEDSWRWPKEDPTVSASRCGYQNLYVWPNGVVEGLVLNSEGRPLEGVPVQAFIKDRRGELSSSPLREEKTNNAGLYKLSGLPPGEVVVGVNGDEYYDRLIWPPTFYPGTADREKAGRLVVVRRQTLKNVDLNLPSPRTPAMLHIEAVLEDGSPATNAVARVENIDGVQRAFVSGDEKSTNILTVPVYIGESYVVKGFRHVATESWEGIAGPVRVTRAEMVLRVVLHEKRK
jgi:hypothetical protein